MSVVWLVNCKMKNTAATEARAVSISGNTENFDATTRTTSVSNASGAVTNFGGLIGSISVSSR